MTGACARFACAPCFRRFIRLRPARLPRFFGMTTLSTPHSSAVRPRKKSKLLTVFLAFIAGAFGAHRFYLKGFLDIGAWLHLLSALLGLAGGALLMADGFTSLFGWITALAGAASLIGGFLAALVYGLLAGGDFARAISHDRHGHSHGRTGVQLPVVL
jgi:TM2 domain-containing membrane protein YozV